MKHFGKNKLSSKRLIGNIEIKVIFDILIKLHEMKKFQGKLFVLFGLPQTGKTESLLSLSFIIGKHIPLVFSSGLFINCSSSLDRTVLHRLTRKAIGIKFYQENFIVKGVLLNLETIEKKNPNFSNFTRITLGRNSTEKVFEISEALLKKILSKKIKIGATVIINRTTGEIYNENNEHPANFEKKGWGGFNLTSNFESIIITEQLVTLEELDNINQNGSLIQKYFAEHSNNVNVHKEENFDEIIVKWVRNNKIKIIKGLLVIDDACLLKESNVNCLKDLLLKFISPSILCVTAPQCMQNHFSELLSLKNLPFNFIDSSLLGAFRPISCKQLYEIIKSRCFEMNVLIKRKVISCLVKIGLECGLKYSLYILSISAILKKNELVIMEDITNSYRLFLDPSRQILLTKCQHFKYFYFN